MIDPFLGKLEELVEQSHAKIRADVAHEKITAMGFATVFWGRRTAEGQEGSPHAICSPRSPEARPILTGKHFQRP